MIILKSPDCPCCVTSLTLTPLRHQTVVPYRSSALLFQSTLCMLRGLITVRSLDPFVILIASCRLMFCKSPRLDVSLLCVSCIVNKAQCLFGSQVYV